MKPYVLLTFVQMCFVASIFSQTPTPKPPTDLSSDYVTVNGGPHPGRIAYKAGMKLLEAVCGDSSIGHDSIAKNYHIRLIRGDKVQLYSFYRLLANPAGEPVLQPGDLIQIPQTIQ